MRKLAPFRPTSEARVAAGAPWPGEVAVMGGILALGRRKANAPVAGQAD